MNDKTVTVTLTLPEVYALRAAFEAFMERERELPQGDPFGNPTWRLDRMVNAITAIGKVEDAHRVLLEGGK